MWVGDGKKLKNMSYNLFLDDQRNANTFLKDIHTWVTVKNYNDFIKTIKQRGLPKFISFDHDLDLEHYPIFEGNINFGKPYEIPYAKYREKTGYDCAKWLIEYCLDNKVSLPDFQIHSMNPVGKDNINKLLIGFRNYQQKEKNENENE